MKTSVIESPLNFVIRETDTPVAVNDEVLVRLEGTGVCASNLPVWEGREWFTYPFEPGAPGHEGYGRVAAVGPEVDSLAEGDKVAMISFHAYAEYDKASVSNVVKLPDSVNGRPFPGEPAACAVNVIKRSDIRKGQRVLVIGAGYLGCMVIQLAKSEGAEVAVVSRRRTSLDYASLAGADHLIVFDDYYRTIEKIRAVYPDNISRVIEATGVQSAIDLATEVIDTRGRLIIAGYHQDGQRSVNMQVWNWKGIDVINAHERDPRIYIEGLKQAIIYAEKNVFQPEKFITHRLDFSEINEAFRLLKERPENFLKAVITY